MSDRVTSLMAAVRSNNLTDVRKSLRERADVTECDHLQRNVVFYLHDEVGVEMMPLLNQFSCDFDHKDSNDETPLMYFTRLKKTNIIKKLLAFCDVSMVDNQGRSALHVAAMLNYKAICQLLVEKSPVRSLSRRTAGNFSCVALACMFGSADVLKLERLAEMLSGHSNDSDHDSLLNLAILSENLDVIKNVLNNAENVDTLARQKNTEGETAVMLAASLKNTPKILSFLLAFKTPTSAKKDSNKTEEPRPFLTTIHERNIRQQTAVFYAVQTDNVESLKTLYKAHCNISLKDRMLQTPLIYASKWNAENCIKELLKVGADPQAQDRYGNTALSFAAKNNNDKIAKKLLERAFLLALSRCPHAVNTHLSARDAQFSDSALNGRNLQRNFL